MDTRAGRFSQGDSRPVRQGLPTAALTRL